MNGTLLNVLYSNCTCVLVIETNFPVIGSYKNKSDVGAGDIDCRTADTGKAHGCLRTRVQNGGRN